MHVHSAKCGCARISVHASMRQDPTRTTLIRRRYEADLVRRFQRVRKAIRETVQAEDGFGLKANSRFDFPRSADKIDAFMRWLEDMERQDILEVSRGMPISTAASTSWQNVYINSAYQKGIAQAAGLMRSQGAEIEQRWIDAGFLRPIHADRIGIIYTRAYNELEGITDAMDQQISRVLAQGLAEGRSPKSIADDLVDRVDKIGITRARMMARTEIIGAHAEATLNSYEEAGVEGVDLLEEFATAGDAQVCPKCRELAAAGPYTLGEARGLIPAHPRCRCAWLPIVKDASGIVLR